MTAAPDEPETSRDESAPQPESPVPHPAPTARVDPQPVAQGAHIQDRWAHRRGEPRVFAFLWTLFLFSATAATFLSALSTGYATPEVMRPATRALMALTLCGIALIWPMVRLSQTADRHPVAGCAQDLIVVLIPAQAVIWPQWFGWLGRWPVSVIGAVSLLCCSWTLLVGGLLAFAQAGHAAATARDPIAPWSSLRWMAVFLVLALGGTIPVLMSSGPAHPGSDATQEAFRASWMLSPICAVYEITRDRAWTGVSAAVVRQHWIALGITAAAAVPLWGAALLRVRGIPPAGGIH